MAGPLLTPRFSSACGVPAKQSIIHELVSHPSRVSFFVTTQKSENSAYAQGKPLFTCPRACDVDVVAVVAAPTCLKKALNTHVLLFFCVVRCGCVSVFKILCANNNLVVVAVVVVAAAAAVADAAWQQLNSTCKCNMKISECFGGV